MCLVDTMEDILTVKSDSYCFGELQQEVMATRKNTKFSSSECFSVIEFSSTSIRLCSYSYYVLVIGMITEINHSSSMLASGNR